MKPQIGSYMIHALILTGLIGSVFPLGHGIRLGDNDGLSIEIMEDGSYTISVKNSKWLRSASTWFQVLGHQYSLPDGALKLKLLDNSTDAGEDAFGRWASLDLQYQTMNARIFTQFRAYGGMQALVFSQIYIDGANITSTMDKDWLISSFPSFMVDDSLADLGYMAYGGIMVAETSRKIGRWDKTAEMESGRNSGPIALFDNADNAIFISPMNNFMVGQASYSQKNGTWSAGIMGGVNYVPKDFTYQTVMFYSSEGINKAIEQWGDAMRRKYNKDTSYRDSDLTINYLSYWTDNGAYYVPYYSPTRKIANLTYEQAMLLKKQYTESNGIPYRSIQYSVWFKQADGGLSEWVAAPDMFPDGMKYMFEKTKWPATAHSRWWSSKTPYAKQNGGRYNFILEEKFGIPQDQQLWDDLFESSRQMGFTCYMQDWLNEQFDNMEATTTDLWVARNWLMQMGEGAANHGITIQYCMSQARHILQSLEIKAVTQARASGDYHPNIEQWRVGMSSMLAHAVGIAPFKDTFWTTTIQPDNFYDANEPYPALQTVVSTLTGGPVGPGDKINGTNITLLMKCCAADGLILKASKPAMSIDAQIKQAAFGGKLGPDGEVWSTYSVIGHYIFGVIFAADLHNSFPVGPTAAGFNMFPTSQVFAYNQAEQLLPMEFTDGKPVMLTPSCTKANFCLYYTTPVLNLQGAELLLLGERGKWIPLSPQRITRIDQDEYDVVVHLKGNHGEAVEFHYAFQYYYIRKMCVLSVAGTAQLRVSNPDDCYVI